MRKSVLVLIFVFVLSLFAIRYSLSPIFAQDFTAAKAYQDYQYQQTNYQQAGAEYDDAKTFYKKNPTLQLREETRKKTLALLKSRDQLMVVYITALRMQLVETSGFTSDEKGEIFSKIDPEVTWYQQHISSYQDGDDLNTLFTKSDESKNRYQSTTKAIIYNAIFDISLSEEIGSRIDHQLVYADLKNFINDQVSLGKIKIDPFNRWLGDTDSVLQTLSQNEVTYKKFIPKFYAGNFNLSQVFDAGISNLNNSVNPLSQLNNYLTEMLNYLKGQSL